MNETKVARKTREEVLEHADIIREYIVVSYRDYRKEFEGFIDDRKLFCVLYDEIMEIISDLECITNIPIWCSVRSGIRESEYIMKRIIKEFR